MGISTQSFGKTKAGRQVDLHILRNAKGMVLKVLNLGGIMSDSNFPKPAWLIYIRVDGIESAAHRIVDAGGQVIHGPMQVPGGGWIVNGLDPEGAMFALTGTR